MFSAYFPSDIAPERLGATAIGIAFALVVWLLGSRAVRGRLHRRLHHVEKVENFEAVPLTREARGPQADARAAARDNVRSRYSIIRKMLAATLGCFVVFVVIFPFLDAVPKALASFLLAVALAIVGIAARPFVENLISGVVISFSNQLRIGDTVMLDGVYYGTVEDINLTHTVVKLWDFRRYIVPNSRMMQKEFLNYSHRDRSLWASVEFHVSYEADIELVERLAREAAESSQDAHSTEQPYFWVREMKEESLCCWLAAWVGSPEEAWATQAEMRRRLVLSLRKARIATHIKRVDMLPEQRSPYFGEERRGPRPSSSWRVDS